jgi:hypothetical protein
MKHLVNNNISRRAGGWQCLLSAKRSKSTTKATTTTTTTTIKGNDRSLTHGHLIDTASILSPKWRHLSPCLGAALESAPFCGNMLRIAKATSTMQMQMIPSSAALLGNGNGNNGNPPSGLPTKLASLLFFQADRQSPVRMTRTKSMAAAHLTPRLIGTLLGVALSSNNNSSRKNEERIRQILREEGIKSNHIHDQWTGVSVARWKELVTLSSAATALQAPPPLSNNNNNNNSNNNSTIVSAMWLVALWEISKDKLSLLEFLLALERHLNESILLEDGEDPSGLAAALRHDPSAQVEWANKTFDPSDLTKDVVQSSFDLLTELPNNNTCEWARALEIVCASTAVQHTDKPAIPNGRYGYDGGPPKGGTYVEGRL